MLRGWLGYCDLGYSYARVAFGGPLSQWRATAPLRCFCECNRACFIAIGSSYSSCQLIFEQGIHAPCGACIFVFQLNKRRVVSPVGRLARARGSCCAVGVCMCMCV